MTARSLARNDRGANLIAFIQYLQKISSSRINKG